MKKKMFLTSAIAMGFVAPAFAAMTDSNTFPDGGLMQENTRYIGAATSTNMAGVYEDGATVDANALYDIIQYSIKAGSYFTGVDDTSNNATTATCTAGSYCPGVKSTTYENEAFGETGIQSCPTIDDATFTSVAGSRAVTACYQDSTKSSAELNPFDTAHLNTSKNTDGYINGVKYANATTTARRYATSATTAGEWAALDESDLAITDLACENGYHYKAGTTAPNLTSLIGITEAADDAGYKSTSGTGYNSNEDKYGITQNGEFVVDYGSKGKIHGHAQCSTRAGTNPWPDDMSTYNVYPENFVSSLTDETGEDGAQYCYCQLDTYTPVSGSAIALSAPWVFRNAYGSADDCASDCANSCASGLRNGLPRNLAYRAAMFSVVQSIPAMCEANTITINWFNADEEDISANNAGTTTYGSDVRTPVKAETIKGKTFKGWRFSKPTTTQL